MTIPAQSEAPSHEWQTCDQAHPGSSHLKWVEGGADEDASEGAAFIAKINLPDPAETPWPGPVPPPELCGYPHPTRDDTCLRRKGHDGDHSLRREILMQIDASDAQKILDILVDNEEYHTKRDEMNAEIHRSTDRIRYSPITSETTNQRKRLETLMREQGVPM